MDKSSVWRTFDEIAPHYDRANRILSCGIDVLWRKKVRSFLPKGQGLQLLDLATGTGDLLAELAKDRRVEHLVGIDMAENMLHHARLKYRELIERGRAEFRRADATILPFADSTFDVATMSFGIRNVANPVSCLREINRVLAFGGTAIILEFSLPQIRVLREVYLFYFRSILPRLGGFISGNTPAYSYLNSSVEEFPNGDNFLALMKEAGFSGLLCKQLSFGIASIYIGKKGS